MISGQGDDRRALIVGEARRAEDPRDRCVHELFEAQAQRTPDAVAVVFEAQRLTYRALNERANQLAHHLRRLGVGPDVLVGLCLERSLELLVGVLGVLKAGGAYVPLDPRDPRERLAFMLEDTGAPVLLVQARWMDALPAHRAHALSLDTGWGPLARERADDLACVAGPDDLAYVIYTSGSTGKPKGVLGTHGGLCNRLVWMQEAFGLTSADAVLQKTPTTFDVSVWELLWPLLVGARLVVARPEGHRDSAYLAGVIAAEAITTVHFVPSMLSVFLGQPGVDACVSLKRVICSGEALPYELTQAFFARSEAALFNLYGPTEASIDVTSWKCLRHDPHRVVPIGRPIARTQLHVLDARRQPVPVGDVGELYIGGVGVARGYLNRPALTAERFLRDPFRDEPGARLYRTGDLGRLRPDGALEYLGRLDHQVKLRGFRVELGEIEGALGQHPSVRDVVVVAREDEPGEKRLVAYLVAREAPLPGVAALRAHLQRTLPDYMVPAAFVELAALPLTPHGKVDRKALPAPEASRRFLEEACVAPRTPLEALLAERLCRLLKIEAIGVFDDFFALGGDSIQAAVFVNRLQHELGEIVHTVVLFQMPTIDQLGAYLVRRYPAAVARVWGIVVDAKRSAGATPKLTGEDVERLRQAIPPLQAGPDPSRARNRPAVLVLSPPRSGSTLLRVMLGGHSRLFAPPELELLSFASLKDRRAAYADPRQAFWLEGTLRAWMELEGCDVEEARRFMERCEAAGMSTGDFYRLLQERAGSRLLVDKTPAYALDRAVLAQAEAIFDAPRYIHLVRHPHDMVRSFVEARLDDVFFRHPHALATDELAEALWVLSHEHITGFLDAIPEARKHVVHFEQLVRDPERAMRAVCQFLEVDFETAMLRPHDEKKTRMTDGLHDASRMLGDVKFHQHAGIDASVADRWRQAEPVRALGEMTWALAAPLGYARPTSGIPRLVRSDGPLPLSFAQQRLWFLDKLEPESAFYNIPAAMRLSGPLDVDALGRSLRALVQRHASLRTTFPAIEGQARQAIGDGADWHLHVVAVQEPEVRGRAEREAQTPFDLARGPLFRATLLRLSAQEHVLLWTLHHIVSDGWSMGVLMQELGALHEAFAAGRPSPLPALPIAYADYAVWQRQWLTGDVLEAKLAYWKEQLGGAPPVIDLPTDRPRPAVQSHRGAALPLSLPRALSTGLVALSRREGVTLFMTLLAAFQVLLQRYTRQDDIVVGSPIAGRTHAETEGLIGLFAHTLVLRTDLSGQPTFRALLARVRAVTLGAYAHQDVPFEKLVEELAPARDLGRSPLFQVMLVLQNATSQPLALRDITLGKVDVAHTTAKFELTLSLRETDEGLRGALEYSTDLFDEGTVARMMGHYRTLLEGIVASPEQPISDLPLLTAAELRQLVAWNDTRVEATGACIHGLFEAQAQRTPDAVALVFDAEQLTYRELNARANQLARLLRALGVGPEVLVGLCVERSLAMVVGLLGILKAGGAYVPLDPTYPGERLAFMLADTEAPVLLTQAHLLATLPAHTAQVLCLDTGWDAIARERPDDLAIDVGPDHLAYVIHTSGSTGKPKGVAIAHGAVVSFLGAMRAAPGLDAADRLLAVTSLSFDIAGLELLLPLSLGACVEVASRALAADGPALAARLASSQITVFQATPATFHLLLAAGWSGDPALKILVGGETVTRELAHALLDRAASVWNMYGPTETTIWSCVHRIARGEGPVPIGTPVASTVVHVLDAHRRPVPVGVPGELYIGGAGLARGYLHRPELTAASFLQDPFSDDPGARLYRTGDLGRRRPDGGLEHLGRLDQQVKIRGFRIELGEVEGALAQHPTVREAVVLAREDAPGDRRLVAYLVAREAPLPHASELRAHLQTRLPDYMVPAAFIELTALPRTPNGKLDRKALAASAEAAAVATDHEAPTDLLEASLQRIWERVLRCPVGLHDSYFDLGGTSIRAVELFARIADTLGHKLPMATLFMAPTVAELAAAIRANDWLDPWKALVAIHASGRHPPLFCVHGALGGIITYRSLSQHMGPDHPVYAFQAEDFGRPDDGRDSIEGIARHYVEEMRRLDPTGPYYLVGHSFGGIIAIEMAQQLLRSGASIALLGLLDTSPDWHVARPTRAEKLRAAVRGALRQPLLPALRELAGRAGGWTMRVVTGQVRGLLRQWEHHKATAAEGGGPTLLELNRHRSRALGRAQQLARAYELVAYPGKVTLFAADQQSDDRRRAQLAGWRRAAADGVAVVPTPGSHFTLLDEPHVAELGKRLSAQMIAERAP